MLSKELREKMIAFSELEISIKELENWLVPRLPFLIGTPLSSDSDVVAAIELGLAELNRSIRSEDDFRRMMKKVLQEYSSAWIYYPSNSNYMTETGSSNKTATLIQSSPGLSVTIDLVKFPQ